jgi:uncharacterized integral membrane protein
MIFFLIVGLIIGAVSVIFILQNIVPVTVTFFNWDMSGSLSVILLLSLLAGMLIAVLILLPSFIKAEWQIRVYKKRIKQLEGETFVEERPQTSRVTEMAPVSSEPGLDIDEELKN